MATGMLGAISLLSLKAHVDGTLLRETGGLFRAEYDIGYWASLIADLLAAARSALDYRTVPNGAPERRL